MTFTWRLLCYLFAFCLLHNAHELRAQEADSSAKASTEAPSEATKKQAEAIIVEAFGLQSRRRYADALIKLQEAEKLDPSNIQLYNLRGSLYLSEQLRNFDLARQAFLKAAEIHPEGFAPFCNLVELEFVSGDFPLAERRTRALLEKFPRLPLPLRHLLQFKLYICLVKQQKEADSFAKEHFTFMDDTPAYYFCKAVRALEAGEDRAANEWLSKAQVIFKKPDNAAYLDALMESKYLSSVDLSAAIASNTPVLAPPSGK